MATEKTFYPVKARKAGHPNQTRRDGFVPGVIYGGRLKDGRPIQIERSVLMDMFRKNTKSSVINVDFAGNRGAVIVKEIQNDPVSAEILHVDLHAIRRDEVLTMGVPVLYQGEEEVTNRRLVVNTNLTEVQIKGPADRIPEVLTVDLTGRTPEDRLEVSSISLPDGLEMVTDPNELLVSIVESRMEQDLEAESAEAAGDEGAEPELVGGKDKAE